MAGAASSPTFQSGTIRSIDSGILPQRLKLKSSKGRTAARFRQ